MPKSGGAAIRMQKEFGDVTFLVGNESILSNSEDIPALPIFSTQAIDFLAELSDDLLHNREAKKYGDIIAYAFWIRRRSLEELKTEYNNEINRVGRGISFQITPSNIPVQFAISMTYSLIAGNISLIRLSSKEFEQVNIICGAINRVISEKCPELQNYICIMRYDRSSDITQILSDRCDIRMIWGGDNTINHIRRFSVQPRCIDLGFADRFSISVIDSDYYLKTDHRVIATDFYNDTYYTDQNACSSTRLVVWTGNRIDEAKEIFWSCLKDEVQSKYRLNDISGSEKLLKTALCAIDHPEIRELRENNAIVRVEIPRLYDDIMQYKGNSGYFFEYETDNIESILPLLKKGCQTVTFLGDGLEDRLRELVTTSGVRGVDRIVLMGHSMDLSLVWDGYDMPITLSRVISNR